MFKWGKNWHFIFKSSNPQNPSMSSSFLQSFGGFLNPQIEVETLEWPLSKEFKILMDLKTHLRSKTLSDSPSMSTTRNVFFFFYFLISFFLSLFLLVSWKKSPILYFFIFFCEEDRDLSDSPSTSTIGDKFCFLFLIPFFSFFCFYLFPKKFSHSFSSFFLFFGGR